MFQRNSDPAGDAVQWDHQAPAGRMQDTAPQTGQHSAPHSAAAPGPAQDRSATASGRVPPRAGARGGNGADAQPQPRTTGSPAGPATEPEAAAPPDTPADTAGTARQAGGAEAVPVKTVERLAGGWRTLAAAAAAQWTPPDVWADGRPALEQVWAYARHGEWTTRSGVWRWAGCIYAFAVAVPVPRTANYLAWICERPSRLLAAALLLIVFAQVPPLSWLV
jgi:hypothetical protein